MTVIVPNDLRDRINAALDVALKDWPAVSDRDRDVLYHEVLAYFNKHGALPEFTVERSLPV